MHITVGTLQGFVASSLSLPTGILTAAFLSRLLGPVNYGALTVAASIVVWIEGAITMGFSRAAVKFVAEAEDWRSVSTRFLQVQFMVSLGAAFFLAAVAPILASWLDTAELSTYLRLFSLGIPFYALFSIHQSILVGRGLFGSRAFLIATYWLIRMVLIFLFVGLWPSVASAIMALIVSYLLVFIGARFFINPTLLGNSDLSFYNLWDFALPIFFYAVGISLFNRLDLFFVKGLSGTPQAAGFYGAAQNLTIVPALFIASLSPLLLSKLTQLCSQNQKESAKAMIKKAIRLTFSLLPFAGMAAGAATEVVVVIYGQSFSSAGQILGILIFAALGVSMIVVSSSALIAADRPELTFYLILPIVVLAFGAHFMLVPRFGSIGAAGVTTGLSWFGACCCMLAVYRVWRVRLPVSTFVRSITICMFAYILASKWQTPGLLILLKLPVISMVIIIAITLFGEFSGDEIAFVRSIFDWRSRMNQNKGKFV
ncbi:MAG: hypothetical protein BBJ57_11450 [Desulfobacterales bacterium PC51MH44]|nr:MAG: hypothetical protein BBJ57_11450 [Desulfobacterales bacterium PC51MH44]